MTRVDSSSELDNSANRNVLRFSHDYGGISGENSNDSRRPSKWNAIDSVALFLK
jgi:hypothetical protein